MLRNKCEREGKGGEKARGREREDEVAWHSESECVYDGMYVWVPSKERKVCVRAKETQKCVHSLAAVLMYSSICE